VDLMTDAGHEIERVYTQSVGVGKIVQESTNEEEAAFERAYNVTRELIGV
jgi:hypothetical protein